MTHVDWHPVKVNEAGKIVAGSRPLGYGELWVSVRLEEINNFTILVEYKGYFDIGGAQFIYAWAYNEDPKPYKPEKENE